MKNSYLTVTDQFCGAGGSSSGATAAGVEVKIAMNHWQMAIDTHSTNFPNAAHDCTDISACNPRRYPSTDILIASPECTNHSMAKGKSRKDQMQPDLFGKVTIDPAEERSRATMWDVPRFAEYHDYRIIIVENVVDARQWVMWDAWLHAMQSLGYDHKCVYFNSMFAHPTPQSRDRLYVVFWKIGNRAPNLEFTPLAHCQRCERNVGSVQAWKNNKNAGRYKKQYVYVCPKCNTTLAPYYHCAANAIDWSIPAQRIGDRPKPLKAKTMKRIQAGLSKFGSQPFMADTVHSARGDRDGDMAWLWSAPDRTQIGQNTKALITPPMVVDLAHNKSESQRAYPMTDPAPTQTSYQTMGMVVPPYIIEMYGKSHFRSIDDPFGTMTSNIHHGVVLEPFLADLRGENAPKSIVDALSSFCAGGQHHGLVLPFVASYYGTMNFSQVDDALPTIVTKERHAVVVPPYHRYLTQHGQTPSIDDCGFRMLHPHEIQKAMAFPLEYVVLGNGRQKVKQLGNAVTPPVMEMIIRRCVASLEE